MPRKKGLPIRKRTTKTDGDRWDIEVYLGRDRETGKKLFHRETFKSYGEAEEEVLKLKRRKRGGGPRPVPSTATFAEWLDHWLKLKANSVRARTLHGYRGAVRRWITSPPQGAPRLGGIRLRDLTVDDFDRLYAFMTRQGHHGRGLKPVSIKKVHVVLRMALNEAKAKGKLGHNPTDNATLPKPNARALVDKAGRTGGKRVRSMSQEQARSFLEAAREDRYSAVWHVLLLGGLRPCEAFALTWDEDVDLEAGTIRIAASLNRVGLDREEYPFGWQLTRAKTDTSHRTVPLPPVAVKELRAWQTQQKRDRLMMGGEWQEHGFVFTASNGSPLTLSNLYNAHFRKVCARAGLGEWEPRPAKPKGQPGPRKQRRFSPAFRIYDLRHTCASLLLKAGESLQVVGARLGHKSIMVTADIYGHLIDGMEQEPANKLEEMFGT